MCGKTSRRSMTFNMATKQLLLTALKEEFFLQVKKPSNKKCCELSPDAAKFFKVFLRSKGKYKQPKAKAFLRCYDIEEGTIGVWGDQVWDDSMTSSLKLAVIDF